MILFPIFGFLFFNLVFLQAKVSAQEQKTSSVNWITFEKVKEFKKSKPKPILIFFYKADEDTSNLMLNTTLVDKDICAYINNKFYAVKFDASSEEAVNFLDDKIYKKDPLKKDHDLITLLLGAKPIIPTVMIYNDKAIGFAFNGYKNQYDMICALIYIAENVEKNTRYEIWAPAYFKTYPPGKSNNQTALGIHWLSLKEALRLNNEKPKKIFLTWYTKWNASSSVVLFNALNQPKVVEYMNQNFYCVRLDAQTADTLVWDKTFVNKNESHHYHDMALAMMKGKMQFPSYFYFDATKKLILNKQFYLSPEEFFMLSNYVGSESYKTIKLADYLKNFRIELNSASPTQSTNLK